MGPSPKRQSVLFLLMLTAVCLLGGLLFGIATGDIFAPVVPAPTKTAALPTGTPAPTIEPTLVAPGEQKSLLVLAVDDAASPAPVLEAVWVVTFRTGVPEYYVLGFPPSASLYEPTHNARLPLGEIFVEDRRLQLGYRLVRDAVQQRFPALSIQTALLLDRSDIAGLVNALGGLPYAGQTLTGPALLASYDQHPVDDSLARLDFQGTAFEALFASLALRQWEPADLANHVRQIPRIAGDNTQSLAMDSFLAGAPSFADSRIVWRAYGPEMETGATQ